MLRRHTVLYVGTRAVAAAGNMFAVAVFTRLAGAEVYGGYLVMLAAANVVSGFAVQWLRYAFFANFKDDGSPAQVPTFVAAVAASLGAALPVAAAVGFISGANMATTEGALALAVAMGLFDATTEVFRTRLAAERVAVASLLRTVLIVVLGTGALLTASSPLALAAGVAAANLLVAALTGRALLPLLTVRPSRAVGRRYVAFGWPLLASFGISAFAQTVDRFVLNHVGGTALVGPYGAASDFVRASFVVIGEALAASIISIARQQYVSGDEARARHTLGIAYRLFMVISGFGIAFFLLFGDVVFALMFPPDFRAAMAGLVPVIVASTVLMILRNQYFGQVIYFSRASHLELISTLILLVTNTSLCLALVPRYGAAGAAWAFLAGQAMSLMFFIGNGLAHRRERFMMPILARPTVIIGALTAAMLACGGIVDTAGLSAAVSLCLKLGVFIGCLVAVGAMLGVRPPDMRRMAADRSPNP